MGMSYRSDEFKGGHVGLDATGEACKRALESEWEKRQGGRWFGNDTIGTSRANVKTTRFVMGTIDKTRTGIKMMAEPMAR